MSGINVGLAKRAAFWAVTVFALFATAPAFSVERLWEAGALAAKTTKLVQLTDHNKNVLAVVSVEQIRRLIAIRDALAPIAGVNAKLFITDGESPNAFATNATGTNIIAFNTAMLEVLGTDNDAIAFVMGHEMGHLAQGHLEAGGNRDVVLGIAGLILGIALDRKIATRTGIGSSLGQNLTSIGAALVSAKFNRDQEREADEVGVRWAHAVGYDPAGALRYWRKMPTRAIDFFSTHPPPGERFANISSQIAGLQGKRQPIIASAGSIGAQSELTAATSNAEFNEAASTEADPVVLGLKAVRENRFYDAFNFATLAAKQGDVRGQLGLGYLHFYGLGTEKDYRKAAEWFELASKQGSATAETFLGIMYENGLGFGKDFVRAAFHYQKASDALYPAGMARYAQLQILGYGVHKDAIAAIELAKKAAVFNEPIANFVLGLAYSLGEGLNSDPAMARQYFELASTQGYLKGDSLLVEIYRQGSGLPSASEEAHWAEAQRTPTQKAFQSYLDAYPDGRYAILARAHVRLLTSGSLSGLASQTKATTVQTLAGKFVGYVTTSLVSGLKFYGTIQVQDDGKFNYKGDNGTLISGVFDLKNLPQFKGVGEIQLPRILGFFQLKFPGGATTAKVELVGKNNDGVVEGTFSTPHERGTFYFGAVERNP